MYLPTAADLGRLGFSRALQTSGIWRHQTSRADVWLVLLPPTAFSLSTGQYGSPARHQASAHTKASFFGLLMALNPTAFKLTK